MNGGSWTGNNSFAINFRPPQQTFTCARCSAQFTNGWKTPEGRYFCGACYKALTGGRTWCDDVLERTPPDLRSKVYRALAAAFHPDTGGDEETMRALNAARERFSS